MKIEETEKKTINTFVLACSVHKPKNIITYWGQVVVCSITFSFHLRKEKKKCVHSVRI